MRKARFTSSTVALGTVATTSPLYGKRTSMTRSRCTFSPAMRIASRRGASTALVRACITSSPRESKVYAGCRRASPARRNFAYPSLLRDSVQRVVEHLVALQRSARDPQPIGVVERPVDDDRHARFRNAAVRAQAVAFQSGEVVLGFRAADADVGARDHRHVAFAVRRQVVKAADVLAAERLLDPVDRRRGRDHVARLRLALAIDAHEPAERAVVADEGIGDRA